MKVAVLLSTNSISHRPWDKAFEVVLVAFFFEIIDKCWVWIICCYCLLSCTTLRVWDTDWGCSQMSIDLMIFLLSFAFNCVPLKINCSPVLSLNFGTLSASFVLHGKSRDAFKYWSVEWWKVQRLLNIITNGDSQRRVSRGAGKKVQSNHSWSILYGFNQIICCFWN